jgi:PAS domain S-box-containing protein
MVKETSIQKRALPMNALFHSKITKRFLTLTMVVVFFSLSAVFTIVIHVLNNAVEHEISYRDELIAKTLSRRMEAVLSRMQNDMRLASNYVLKYSVEEKNYYVAEMERLVAYNPLYRFVQVYDSKGEPIVRVPDSHFDGANMAGDLRYRLSWTQSPYISDLLRLPDGSLSIAIAHPAIDSNGEVAGAVVGYVNLNTLSDYLSELAIGSEGINVILDRQGIIAGHTDPSMLGLALTDHPVADALYKDRYGVWLGELFDREMIAVHRPLKYGYGLIVSEPLTQALRPSQETKRLLFSFHIVVLALSIAAVLYGTSKIHKPILQLIKQARSYKDHRTTSFERLRTNDELEELSSVMGQMAWELTEKERRLYYILESIPYCVITTDNKGTITTFNRGAEELTLFSREEAIGKKIIDLPIKQNEEAYFSWKTIQEGTEFNEVETHIFDKEKRTHVVHLYSSIFKGEDERPIGAILIMRDVGEMKKLEGYLRQNERLAAMGLLTAGIAHEIKNPLSIIHAAAEALEMELKDDEPQRTTLKDLTNDIVETSERMNGLLADFLHLGREYADGEHAKLSLATVLDELLQLLRSKIKENGIEVFRNYESPCAEVVGDKNRLAQVFLNIFLNAIQATENGGNIFVRIKDGGACWIVQIEDTGKGLSGGKLQLMFHPFFSTKLEGTGLGLSIAHEIVTQHGGTIYASSEEGIGTKLFVELPKAREAEEDDE